MTIGELLGHWFDFDESVELYEEIDVSWIGHENDRRAGYLKVDFKFWDGGSASYAGVEHPDGLCDGEHVCIHCGRTMH